MDFEEFYQNHIPKSCLPSNYGGDLDSVENSHANHKELLLSMKEYFSLDEKQMNFKF